MGSGVAVLVGVGVLAGVRVVVGVGVSVGNGESVAVAVNVAVGESVAVGARGGVAVGVALVGVAVYTAQFPEALQAAPNTGMQLGAQLPKTGWPHEMIGKAH